MIQGIRDVYLNVSNMERAVSFYVNVLGFKVADSHEHWSNLDKDGFRLGLHWTEGAEVPHTPRDSHGAHAGATITFVSTDITSDKKLLESNGCKILGEADMPWGHMLVFEDLDGNVLKLMKSK